MAQDESRLEIKIYFIPYFSILVYTIRYLEYQYDFHKNINKLVVHSRVWNPPSLTSRK